FIARHGGDAHFTHDDAGGVICDDRGFVQFCARREGERERSDYGVAGAGNVINFARRGWDVRHLFFRAEQAHSKFAASDQHIFAAGQIANPPGGRAQGPFVSDLDAASAFGLVLIRRDHIDLAIVSEISDLRVEADHFGPRSRRSDHRAQHARRQQSLVVIGDYHGVGARYGLVEGGDYPVFDAARDRRTIFAVGPNYLLVLASAVCDDARLARGRAEGVRDDAVNPGVTFSEAVAQHLRRFVSPDDADRDRARAEFHQVRNDVARPAQMPGLAFDLDHRRRSFGRDAARLSPNEFVEHQIANRDDPQVGEFTDDLLSSLIVHFFIGTAEIDSSHEETKSAKIEDL